MNTFKLKDICDIKRGSSPRPKGDPKLFGGDIPRLTIRDVTRDGKYVTPKIDFLTEEGAKQGRFSPKGTLTMSVSGTIGSVSFLEVAASVHDGFVLFENIKKIIDIDYLYYFLKGYDYESLILDGGIFKNLTTDIIKEIEIIVPDINIQKEIVKSLILEENKIEKIKSLLEKIEIRNQYYADKLLSGELSIDEDGNLSKIKKNFDSFKFDNIIEENDKSKIKAGDGLKNGLYKFFNCSKEQKLFLNEFLNNKKSILLSTGGTASVHYCDEPHAYSTDVWSIRPIEDINAKYIYYYYKSNILEIENCFQGAGLKHLSKKDFKKIAIKIPNIIYQNDIVKFLDKLEDEKSKVERLLELEEKRFEWLSDKLLSGEYIIED